MPGIPQHKIVTMPYADSWPNTVSTGGVHNLITYNANSIFDPQNAVGGHQPYSHDQWALFYKDYTVLSSYITVTFSWSNGDAAGSTVPVLCGVVIDSNNLVDAAPFTKREKFPGSFKTLYPGETQRVSVRAKYNGKLFWGKRDIIDLSAQQALMSADPTALAYFNIVTQAADGASTTDGVHVSVKLSYRAKLLHPVEIAGS